jgi:hypothetical protein
MYMLNHDARYGRRLQSFVEHVIALSSCTTTVPRQREPLSKSIATSPHPRPPRDRHGCPRQSSRGPAPSTVKTGALSVVGTRCPLGVSRASDTVSRAEDPNLPTPGSRPGRPS